MRLKNIRNSRDSNTPWIVGVDMQCQPNKFAAQDKSAVIGDVRGAEIARCLHHLRRTHCMLGSWTLAPSVSRAFSAFCFTLTQKRAFSCHGAQLRVHLNEWMGITRWQSIDNSSMAMASENAGNSNKAPSPTTVQPAVECRVTYSSSVWLPRWYWWYWCTMALYISKFQLRNPIDPMVAKRCDLREVKRTSTKDANYLDYARYVTAALQGVGSQIGASCYPGTFQKLLFASGGQTVSFSCLYLTIKEGQFNFLTQRAQFCFLWGR